MLQVYTLLQYLLAVMMWTLIGRGALRLLIPGDPGRNKVYQLFTWVCWPALAPARALLPRAVPDSHIGFYTLFAVLVLRVGLYMLFYSQGWLAAGR